tara:strand:- start:1528 stop:1968 length:441 start_codon:yes stop_codon:yes gene_type:complete
MMPAATNPAGEAAKAYEMAMKYAEDAEKIAAVLPDAKTAAEEARAAATEAEAAMPEVEAAKEEYESAMADDPQGDAAITAHRTMEDAARVVKQASERAHTACEQAKSFLPDISELADGEEEEADEPEEPEDTEMGLNDWADRAVKG